MPIPTYTPGYPPDGSSLGQTKATIRNNLDGTFETLAVDHINNNGQPGSQPAGYHNVIHIVPQGSNPGTVSGYGQLYSKTVDSYTTDQALFWETGSGLIQQLTTNFNPKVGTNGYTFLPGGIIFQWGVINSPGTSGTVMFATSNINFPNNIFLVQLTLFRDSGSQTVNVNSGATFNTQQFSYLSSSGGSNNIFWTAIGY